ncbi:redox-regulated ATPase YchF [Mycoplasmatota bacterium]|nr:redox-regulated ATPase YchF [Mycoplasmatota bacterium]
MSLTCGIVGLPNVGKSTLFNALTKAGAVAANYPFATIEPNVGVVEVPDDRLSVLNEMFSPKKLIPTLFEFTDIAGLVKGASKGEGLGNKFLSHIREVDAIAQVVRCFVDSNITHVDGMVDPLRDIETINLELILADIEVIEKRLPKIEKKALLKTDKEIVREYEVLVKVKEALENELPARSVPLNINELKTIKHYSFLTLKPMLYVANISLDELKTGNDFVKDIEEYAGKYNDKVIVVSAQIESELSELENDEKEMFLEDLGINESGLDKLIRESYSLLGLKTYFTAGEKEVRAWTYSDGMNAKECAGIIHSDFERGFIRAETIAYGDLVDAGSEKIAKEIGKMRLEGKDYEVKDGDVLHFRFNV